jgi:hypothetical protein
MRHRDHHGREQPQDRDQVTFSAARLIHSMHMGTQLDDFVPDKTWRVIQAFANYGIRGPASTQAMLSGRPRPPTS